MADVAVWKTVPAPEAIAYERTEAIPWHLWAGLLAATCAVVGGQWDISWHRTIGRDTFWTPAHIVIYLCGVIAGFSSAAVVLTSTFGKTEQAAATVRLWGFRAPLGSFMCIWGAVAMIASAPFDDWWHNAYGLDVKILSPPHAVLAAGLGAIIIGARFQVLGEMNRATGRRRRLLEWMFLYSSVMLFVVLLTLIMEYTFRNNMHRSQFYQVTAAVAMLVLPGVARACQRRWSASLVAAGYSVFLILLILILPLFPAEAKLGPVFQQVKFFIPPEFPLLVFFPALVLDWVLRRYQSMNKWALSALAGTAFFAVFAAVQWPFANFLMSPWSRNWFFGSHYLPYFARPEGFYARYIFFEMEPLAALAWGMASGLLWTILATRFSIGGGDWMKTVQR